MIRIVDWDEHFENHETRKLGRLHWLRLPIKLDGWSYVRLALQEEGATYLGVWMVLLEVAAGCKPRGELRRPNGEPMTVEDVAVLTRLRPNVIEQSLNALAAVGWVELSEKSPGASGNDRDVDPGRNERTNEREKPLRQNRKNAKVDFSALVSAWNQVAERHGLPRVRLRLSDERKALLSAFYAEAGDLETASRAFEAAGRDYATRNGRWGLFNLVGKTNRQKWIAAAADPESKAWSPSDGD